MSISPLAWRRLAFIRLAERGSGPGATCRYRKRQPKRGTDAGLTFTGNCAAVGNHDFMDDGQAQPGPAATALTRDAEEFLEDVGNVFGRNADAGVRDRQGDRVCSRRGGKGYLAPRF